MYNLDTDKCREVTVTPDDKWGGEGSLGCGIGYGYLHRIPITELEDSTPKADVPTPGPASNAGVPMQGSASPAPSPNVPTNPAAPEAAGVPTVPTLTPPMAPSVAAPSSVHLPPTTTYHPTPTATSPSAPVTNGAGATSSYLPPPSSIPYTTAQQTQASEGLPTIPGMPVTTPINLPGMPPITVSATVPAAALQALQQPSQFQAAPTGQYQSAPNQFQAPPTAQFDAMSLGQYQAPTSQYQAPTSQFQASPALSQFQPMAPQNTPAADAGQPTPPPIGQYQYQAPPLDPSISQSQAVQ